MEDNVGVTKASSQAKHDDEEKVYKDQLRPILQDYTRQLLNPIIESFLRNHTQEQIQTLGIRQSLFNILSKGLQKSQALTVAACAEKFDAVLLESQNKTKRLQDDISKELDEFRNNLSSQEMKMSISNEREDEEVAGVLKRTRDMIACVHSVVKDSVEKPLHSERAIKKFRKTLGPRR